MGIFKAVAKDIKARAGYFNTPHGRIETPVFMPVGTQASVKALSPDDLDELGAQIILANTYHLYLRPGEKLIKKFGGLHKFMNWDKPILTDSGGFQVMSLKNSKFKMQKSKVQLLNQKLVARPMGASHLDYSGIEPMVVIDEEGVTFKSHLDGSKHKFTPERSIKIQHDLGADIIMAFDEVVGDSVGRDYSRIANDKTNRWAKSCLKEHKKLKNKQFLFGIIQGSIYEDLRRESAKFISSLDFDGIALGGESIGFNNKATKDILSWVGSLLPVDKPHYAMGVGEVETVFICIEGGVDMFDCVSPTRRARNGSLYISPKNGGRIRNNFQLSISNSQFRSDKTSIDLGCLCYTCQNFSRAYLRHLFFAKELLFYRLSTYHNVYFMSNLVRQIRNAILNKQFLKLKKNWLGR